MPIGNVSFERKVLATDQTINYIPYTKVESWIKSVVPLCPFKRNSFRDWGERVKFDMDNVDYDFASIIEKVYMLKFLLDNNLSDELTTHEFNHLLGIDSDIFNYDVNMKESCKGTKNEEDRVIWRKQQKQYDKRNSWNNELGDQVGPFGKIVDQEDLERRGETKSHTITGVVVNKLPQEWFKGMPYKKPSPVLKEEAGTLDIALVQESIDKQYWESDNDGKRLDLEWDELSFNDWVRIKFGKVCKMTKDRILKDYWRDKFNEEQENRDGVNEEEDSYNEM
ncbi:hypothetical protein Tco_0654702 [Tanacetum coccineum]|uniref:Peptidase M10 metallopeptidase domain-containing protein n=1 Tax=Tanacetum coccineum TaxID=301880 RepID=A0ABQ4X4G7_9ASTR